jgi:hypothetical protein
MIVIGPILTSAPEDVINEHAGQETQSGGDDPDVELPR